MKGFQLLLLAAAALPATAQAQTVNLYCSNPNLRYSYFIDVDYAARTVNYRMDTGDGHPGKTYPARISDTQIIWEEPPVFRGDGTMVHTVNRVTGHLNSCDSKEGCFQRACRPAQRQF